jgi:predicted site-specific integrase-resolvase
MLCRQRVERRDRSTIRRWLESGVLRLIIVPGGKRMVQAQSLERLIEGDAKPRGSSAS